MTLSAIPEPLQPLVALMLERGDSRLIARCGHLLSEGASGSARLALPWSAEQQASAVSALPALAAAGGAFGGQLCAGALVLQAAPSGDLSLERLQQAGWLSSLAARTLQAALAQGRNLLITGPRAVAWPLQCALVQAGLLPVLWARPGEAAPTAWLQAHSLAELRDCGADRIVLASQPAAAVMAAMQALSGVVAYLDAGRLERALMRFEVAQAQPGAIGSAPLQVLAGLDLVLVVGRQGGPRLLQVAEIVLMPSGYRPRLLFATGQGSVAAALVPLAFPTCLDPASDAGEAASLLEELRHAVAKLPRPPSASPPPGRVDAATQAAPPGGSIPPLEAAEEDLGAFPDPSAYGPFDGFSEPSQFDPEGSSLAPLQFGPGGPSLPPGPQTPPPAGRGVARAGLGTRSARRPAAPRPGSSRAAARRPTMPLPESDPGWELDQAAATDAGAAALDVAVPAAALLSLRSPAEAQEDALMGATFGLGPPPRPLGVPPRQPQTFRAVLEHADREGAMAAAARTLASAPADETLPPAIDDGDPVP